MEEQHSPSGSMTRDRTTLAVERTKLAEERTFAAWIRTALAAAGIGVGLVKLLPTTENKLLVKGLGILFVTAGLFIFVVGLRSYRDIVRELESKIHKRIPSWLTTALTIVFLLGTTLGLVWIILD